MQSRRSTALKPGNMAKRTALIAAPCICAGSCAPPYTTCAPYLILMSWILEGTRSSRKNCGLTKPGWSEPGMSGPFLQFHRTRQQLVGYSWPACCPSRGLITLPRPFLPPFPRLPLPPFPCARRGGQHGQTEFWKLYLG